jgi:signal transduction histidine kinase
MIDLFLKMAGAETAAGVTPALLAEAKDMAANSNLEYLMGQIPRAIEQSIEGIGRIASIVQAMQEFSHPGTTLKTTVDLNQCIRSTAMVSHSEWKYVADLDLDLDEALPQISCLPGAFNQALLAMIVNSVHAIGDIVGDGSEGKGKIRTESGRHFDPKIVESFFAASEKFSAIYEQFDGAVEAFPAGETTI